MANETPEQVEVETLLRRGLDYYGKDFHEEAAVCWRQVLALAPGERRAIEYLEAMGLDASPMPPSVERIPSTIPPLAPGLRVLIADGSETQIRLLSALLRGAEVMGATSLRAAVEIGRATRPDLALMACLLPGGGGVRAIEAMRLTPEPLKTSFVLTATPAEAPLVRSRLSGLGASLYIKPFARDPLLRLLAGLGLGPR